MAAQTTAIGYRNKNDQVVVRATTLSGNLPGQRLYVLRCERAGCGSEYGANGCDIHERKCPFCQKGAAGLAFEGRE